MRAKNSFYNLIVSLGMQMINVILQFVSRYIFIQYFSKEYLGVNGLFSEILTVFSLAELGIGVSMMYGLYAVVSQHQEYEICCLMNLYRRLYAVVGVTVAIIGCVLLPFLNFFVGETDIPHIRWIYLMYLSNSVISYFFSYKQTLIRAYQKEYIVSIATQAVKCLQTLIQILVIIFLKNFYLYLGVQIISQIGINIVLAFIADKMYPFLKKDTHTMPEKKVKQDIYKHIKAMAIHRFGSVFVFNTDNLILSMFVGLGMVGVYSNYKMVINNLKVVSDYIYNAITASVGNLTVTEQPKKVLEIYHCLNMGTSLMYGWMSVCLLVLFNPFIDLFFGKEFLLPFSTVIVIVIDFYILGMRQMTVCFRNALGVFWYDRYKPLFEVSINLGVSLLLVRKYELAGVIGGTIISSLCTNFWVEPYVFFKYGIGDDWKKNIKDYYFRYGKFTFFTLCIGALCFYVSKMIQDLSLFWLIIDAVVISGIYIGVAWVVFSRTREWKYLSGKAQMLLCKMINKSLR